MACLLFVECFCLFAGEEQAGGRGSHRSRSMLLAAGDGVCDAGGDHGASSGTHGRGHRVDCRRRRLQPPAAGHDAADGPGEGGLAVCDGS
jgi:hypothetical protein